MRRLGSETIQFLIAAVLSRRALRTAVHPRMAKGKVADLTELLGTPHTQLLAHASRREIIERWRHDYNHLRPHSSLGALTPSEFAAIKREQTTPHQEGETTGGLYL
jgi:transposase InsO family protein